MEEVVSLSTGLSVTGSNQGQPGQPPVKDAIRGILALGGRIKCDDLQEPFQSENVISLKIFFNFPSKPVSLFLKVTALGKFLKCQGAKNS